MEYPQLINVGVDVFVLGFVAVASKIIHSNINAHNKRMENAVSREEMEKYVTEKIEMSQLDLHNDIKINNMEISTLKEIFENKFAFFSRETSNKYTEIDKSIIRLENTLNNRDDSYKNHIEKIFEYIEAIKK